MTWVLNGNQDIITNGSVCYCLDKNGVDNPMWSICCKPIESKSWIILGTYQNREYAEYMFYILLKSLIEDKSLIKLLSEEEIKKMLKEEESVN